MVLLRGKTAFLVFGFMVLAFSSAEAREPRTRRLPLGSDVCAVLLRKTVSADSELPRVNAAEVDHSPGWGVGPTGTGTALRGEFERLLRGRRDSGQTEEQAVVAFLNQHGYEGAESMLGRNSAPEAPSRQKLKEIQEAVNTTDVESIAAAFATRKNKTTEDVKDAELVLALDNIERRSALTSDDLKAIERLHAKVRGLSTRSDRLRSLVSVEGQADLVVWNYLKQHDKTFRTKIKDAREGQNLYITFPKINKETGKVFIDVRKITDLDDYKVFYDEAEAKGIKVLKYNTELRKYAWDYLKYRHFANRLKAIDNRSVTFNLDLRNPDPTKPELVARHEEIVAAEQKNQIAYINYRDGIAEGIKPHRAIHPSPSLLRSLRFRNSYLRNWNVSKNYYLTAVGVGLTGYVANNLVKWIWGLTVVPTADYFEKENAFKEEYWIAKCSKEKTKEAIEACLKRWGAIAGNALDEINQAKLAKDPEYGGLNESIRFARLSNKIVTGTNKAAGFRLNSQITLDNDMVWIPQIGYSILQKEVHKFEENQVKAKETADKPKPSKPESAATAQAPAASGAGLLAGPSASVKEDTLRKFSAMHDAMLSKTAELKKNLNIFQDDPAKQVEFLWNYQGFLATTSYKLTELVDLELGSDFQARLEGLHALIEEESLATLIKVQSFAPKRSEEGGAALVPPATGDGGRPSNAASLIQVPPTAVTPSRAPSTEAPIPTEVSSVPSRATSQLKPIE